MFEVLFVGLAQQAMPTPELRTGPIVPKLAGIIAAAMVLAATILVGYLIYDTVAGLALYERQGKRNAERMNDYEARRRMKP